MTSKKQQQSLTDHLADYVGSAFTSGMDSARTIHHAAADIPLNILQGIGLGEDNTESLRQKHQEIVDALYDSIGSMLGSIGRAGVEQVNLLRDAVAESTPPRKAAPARKSRAKAKSKARTRR